jgi:SAM-dependent methyltransferase
MPYPRSVADALRAALGLDGTRRLLDVGCGPGSLTYLLAPLFAETVGVDADADMVREAASHGPPGARFVRMRAEELPADLGTFRVVTFAQSFHWMEQDFVARAARGMLEPGGAVVHVGATTHQGEGDVPRDEIVELVRSYLGPVRRAGRSFLPEGTPRWEDNAFRAAGFRGPERFDVPGGVPIERSEDDVVASVYSMSTATPHLLGDRLEAFEAELRALLRDASPSGRFYERVGEIGLRIWTT